jgi:polyphosphate kinase
MSSAELKIVENKPARAAKAKAPQNEPSPEPRSVPASLDDPSLYINRELSLLAFQARVLEEAQDETNPLLERVKFISILGSNLDEFFMVRVAGVRKQVERGVRESGPDGLTPEQQLEKIRQNVSELFQKAQECLHDQLLPALAKEGIEVLDYPALSNTQKAEVNRYFCETVFPTLTPLAVDPGRPFPHVSNLSLNLAVLVRDAQGAEHFARVKVPDSLPQLVPVQPAMEAGAEEDKSRVRHFVLLEQLITANLGMLFPGMEVVEANPFHVTRDADTAIQQLEAGDLLESIEETVWRRRFADVVRLEIHESTPPAILEILASNFEVEPVDIYRVRGLVGLSRLKHLAAIPRPDLKYKTFVPTVPVALQPTEEGGDIFSAIRRQDVLLHHPFVSFQPVVSMLKAAAMDPAVLAIKITLYRVGRNSPIVEALLQAVENAKQVAALVELKARFDEESNIEWARALEHEGVHVVYGLMNFKVHSKVALIVRQEGDTIRRYVHLSTGNYNAVTAQLYTDIGLLTSDDAIGADCSDLFNYLTGYSAKKEYRKLLVAPVDLRRRIEHLIQREIQHQKDGKRGHVILKINALVDSRIIRNLYEASQAGVQVDLLVRGICCLRPGIPGISENIRVTSIVGRFLEHSRIFYFRNGGEDEIYLGSADMMPRNLDRRVEIIFPVQDAKLVELLRDKVLSTYLKETAKARIMHADGSYSRSDGRIGADAMDSQAWFLENSATKSGKRRGALNHHRRGARNSGL